MSELTNEQIQKAIDMVWVGYPSCKMITMPAMTGMVHRYLNTNPVNYKKDDERVRTYILQNLKVMRGRNGGIMNPANWAAHKARMETYTKAVVANGLFDKAPATAINNHTCPCCGNDRVSKSESTCWKCGGSLHG